MKKIFVLLLALTPFHLVQAESWSYGLIKITESYSDKIMIRWSGPDTEQCGQSVVAFNTASLGDAEAVKRATAIALTATASQKPIRFHLNGCIDSYQKAVAVQLCANSDCSY